jgi:hypothetical protein
VDEAVSLRLLKGNRKRVEKAARAAYDAAQLLQTCCPDPISDCSAWAHQTDQGSLVRCDGSPKPAPWLSLGCHVLNEDCLHQAARAPIELSTRRPSHRIRLARGVSTTWLDPPPWKFL